ncbi:FxSxx-COOH protein [Streptomyces sp. NBC_00012]
MNEPVHKDMPDSGPSGGPDALPDLLELDLRSLRTLDHPVLAEVVADLRGRVGQPREMLWGFNNSF